MTRALTVPISFPSRLVLPSVFAVHLPSSPRHLFFRCCKPKQSQTAGSCTLLYVNGQTQPPGTHRGERGCCGAAVALAATDTVAATGASCCSCAAACLEHPGRFVQYIQGIQVSLCCFVRSPHMYIAVAKLVFGNSTPKVLHCTWCL